MSRRREIRGLVAGVVVAIGLVGPPSIAQAAEPPPKSYDNLRELTTTKVPTIADGRIDLDSTVLGQIHCVVSLYGYAWNERDHGATGKPPPRGYGEVVGLGASCEPLQLKLELEPRPAHALRLRRTADRTGIKGSGRLHGRIQAKALRMPEPL